MLKTLPTVWQGPARGALAGAVVTLGMKGAGYVGSQLIDLVTRGTEEEEAWEEELREVYLEGGPKDWIRYVLSHDEYVEDREEAEELLEEFEEAHADVVRRFNKSSRRATGNSDDPETPSRRRRRRRNRRGDRATNGPELSIG